MIIAITGGIGSGKSLASDILIELGYSVIDTDIIAHEMSRPSGSIYNNIVNIFGENYLRENGEIDRKKLGECIFNNKEKRKLLESITHPLIMHAAMDRCNAITAKNPNATVFVVVPLLFDNMDIKEKYLPYDYSLLITASDDIRIERLISYRGLTHEEAALRISSQMPEDEKKRHADFVIENNGNKEELKLKIKSLLTKINFKK